MFVLKLKKDAEICVHTPKEVCTLSVKDLIVNNSSDKAAKIQLSGSATKSLILYKPNNKFGFGDINNYFISFSILKISPSKVKIGIESFGGCSVYRR